MYQDLQVGLRRQWWEYGRKERMWAATSFGRPGSRVRASSIARRNVDDDGGSGISFLVLSLQIPSANEILKNKKESNFPIAVALIWETFFYCNCVLSGKVGVEP